MIHLGIDVSKYFHLVHIRNGKNSQPFRIENDKNGIEFLKSKLKQLNETELLIGIESTGHYWKHISKELQESGYKVQIINSHHVKKYKEIEDNTPNKNDNKDSKIISKLLSDGKGLHANIEAPGIYGEIKSLYEARERLVEDIKRHKTLIRVIIERYFPEYEKVFKSGIWIKSSIKLLSEIGLLGFKNKSSDEIEALISKSSKGHYESGIGEKLKKLFEETIGLKEGLLGAGIELKYRLQMYNETILMSSNLEKALLEQLEKTEEWKYLQTIPGVGIIFASGILSELGDMSKYTRSRAVTKMSGLNLASNSSGKYQGRLAISRRGRSKLRKLAYMISLNLIRLDNNVKKLYDRKLKEGKSPINILIKISDKVLRMIRHLIINKTTYDSEHMYLA